MSGSEAEKRPPQDEGGDPDDARLSELQPPSIAAGGVSAIVFPYFAPLSLTLLVNVTGRLIRCCSRPPEPSGPPDRLRGVALELSTALAPVWGTWGAAGAAACAGLIGGAVAFRAARHEFRTGLRELVPGRGEVQDDIALSPSAWSRGPC